ncbi:MAG: aldehyde dehydrogenase EutE, partial [Candidatus Aminicenantes bacterium]|nr:aldehyde dehydrogenase EutE [Candidatus Aminicenantes bacterium]MCK5005464.1 aldehyde dehydrogenase EutE [Candidatus Aminicenantes bacterium]
MAPLKKEEIDRIAERVVSLLNKENIQDNIVSNIGNGIFTSIDSAVKAAAIAQKKFVNLPLEQRGEIISNIRKEMLNYAEELAKMAWDETGMGRLEDKVQKNRLVINKTPGTEILKPDAYSGDHGLTLMELAPHGVIGSITPSTNPTSTIICNTIGMIAAGNSVVFNAHPNAKKVSIYNIQLLNKAITEAGGPENVVTTVESPTIQTASELMKHPGINLLVVTGGEAVVKAAMESGKRAICAGPGNPPVVVDETADIENAAKCIVKGASLDNNIICVLEKEIFAVESIADQLLDAFSRNNAVVLSEEQIRKLDKVLFTEQKGPGKPGVINKNYIGKNIQVILKEIGMDVSPDIRMAVAPVKEDHPLVWTEQLLPVIPLVRVPDVDYGIDIAVKAEHGFRHTAIMHSRNIDKLSRMAKEINCSIFVKNGPSVA